MVVCGLVLGVPAIVFGLMARREIRESEGGQNGDGLAVAGIALGVIATVFSTILLSIVAITFLGQSADDRFERISQEIDGGSDYGGITPDRRYVPLDEVNSDPSDFYCNQDRFLQDPDC
jgi:hypothetical protein